MYMCVLYIYIYIYIEGLSGDCLQQTARPSPRLPTKKRSQTPRRARRLPETLGVAVATHLRFMCVYTYIYTYNTHMHL